MQLLAKSIWVVMVFGLALFAAVACDSGQDGVNVTQIEPPTVTATPLSTPVVTAIETPTQGVSATKAAVQLSTPTPSPTPSPTATRSSNDPSDGETLMRLFTKVSREIKNHPRYVDIESNFIECVNSHTDLGIDEFADFYVTYIGENIEVYDRCGDESGIFIIYEDLWASIIEDLRQRDEEIDTLLSDEYGERYASGEALEWTLKIFAELRSERLASATPRPEIDSPVEMLLERARDVLLWGIGNDEALWGCEEKHGEPAMRDAMGARDEFDALLADYNDGELDEYSQADAERVIAQMHDGLRSLSELCGIEPLSSKPTVNAELRRGEPNKGLVEQKMQVPTATPVPCPYLSTEQLDVDRALERWLCEWEKRKSIGALNKGFKTELDPETEQIMLWTRRYSNEASGPWGHIQEHLDEKGFEYSRTQGTGEFYIYGISIEHIAELYNLHGIRRLGIGDRNRKVDDYWLDPKEPFFAVEAGTTIQLSFDFESGWSKVNFVEKHVTVSWTADSDEASLVGNGRHAEYTAPDIPGEYTVTAQAPGPEDCYLDCEAVFTVVVRDPDGPRIVGGGYDFFYQFPEVQKYRDEFHGEPQKLYLFAGFIELPSYKIAGRMRPVASPSTMPTVPDAYKRASGWYSIELVDGRGNPFVNEKLQVSEICTPMPSGWEWDDPEALMVLSYKDDLIPEVYANYQRYDFVEHIESRLIVVSTESTSSTGPAVACTDTLRHVVPDYVATVARSEQR